MQDKKVYPDMKLYQEIILLQQWGKNKWVVENVIPYYEHLIKPSAIVHRHSFWSNFNIRAKEFPKFQTCKMRKEREFLQNEFGFNIDKYDLSNKRQVLRNCVVPELGLHIFDCAFKLVQKRVIEG
jgi:DNA (cytosine-5)-methyltransferase 1